MFLFSLFFLVLVCERFLSLVEYILHENIVLSKFIYIYFRHRKADTGKPRGENRETSKTVPAFQKLFFASDLLG